MGGAGYYLTIDGYLNPARWDEATVDAVGPIWHGAGLHTDHEWVAEVVPGQVDVVLIGRYGLGPERLDVAGLAEFRVDDRDGGVAEVRIQRALNILLELSNESYIVGVNHHLVVGQFTGQEQDMSIPHGG